MRKRLWQLHSWMGLFAGAGLLVIGLTGSLLVFREEVETSLHLRPVHATAPETSPRMGYDALLAKVRAQLPHHDITAWDSIMYGGATDGIVVVRRGSTPKAETWREVNPSNGELLPERERTALQRSYDWVLKLHYTLLLGDWGMLFAGVLAALLCFLGLSGVYLYRQFWKTFFTLRWNRSARIFFSDLHKMTGISSVVFNLILGFTGAWWNLPVLKTLLADPPPAEQPKEAATTSATPAKALSMDALVAEAARLMPGLNTKKVYFHLPTDAGLIEVYGSVTTTSSLVNDYNSHATFDAATGAVSEFVDYRHATAWEKFEAMMSPLHFGTFGGWPVKALWTVLGLSPGVLAVSGSLIWFRRHKRARTSP